MGLLTNPSSGPISIEGSVAMHSVRDLQQLPTQPLVIFFSARLYASYDLLLPLCLVGQTDFRRHYTIVTFPAVSFNFIIKYDAFHLQRLRNNFILYAVPSSVASSSSQELHS